MYSTEWTVTCEPKIQLRYFCSATRAAYKPLCASRNFMLEKATGTSTPSGLVWVKTEDTECAEASTYSWNGLVKSTTYNGSVVALYNRRLSSSNARCWTGPQGIFAATRLAVRSVNDFAISAKFYMLAKIREKSQNSSQFSLCLWSFHFMDSFDLLRVSQHLPDPIICPQKSHLALRPSTFF